MHQASTLARQIHVDVRTRVTCPHCWHNFATEDIFWVAEHEALRADPRLGADAHQRFLPSRFDVAGNAIDSRDMTCQSLACPACHLTIPRVLVDIAPLFVSILGIPSCGKSYFLASMTYHLGRTLPRYFRVAFGDADPTSNQILSEYVQKQFLNPNRNAAVKLAKTEEQGHWYDTVQYGDQTVAYPRPFLFTLDTLPGHPSHGQSSEIARCLCLYDNAGESFQPGKDNVAAPVTRHLTRSQANFFLFDPTQDSRFQAACAEQFKRDKMEPGAANGYRQDTILHEAANRIRKFSGLRHDERHARPLFVIVTKYDAWSSLLPGLREITPWRKVTADGLHALDWRVVSRISSRTRDILWDLAPELVASAEGFAQDVLYFPVSATGCAPVIDEQGNRGIRPADIQPCWIEVPMLTAIARYSRGLVPYVDNTTSGESKGAGHGNGPQQRRAERDSPRNAPGADPFMP